MGREILLGNSWTNLVTNVVGVITQLVDEVLIANTILVVAGAVLSDSWSCVLKVAFGTATTTPSELGKMTVVIGSRSMVSRTAHPFPVRRGDVTFPDIVLLGSSSPWTLVSASPAAPADPLSAQIGPAEAVELADG